MRPIKLTMSAFGPYANNEEIEFDRFNENSPFLITGDTGAGKTTIFDAISYALYGETSGSYRDTSDLRSDFADDETETYVILQFIHRGKTYEIKRSPAYMRKKKRGSGYTKHDATVDFSVDGKQMHGLTAQINKAIVDLLRIDFAQFKQITMIAQGEFYQLINADTETRSKILRKIFMTDKYQKMSDDLKEKTRIAKDKTQEITRAIMQEFSAVDCAEDSEFLEKLKNEKEASKDNRYAPIDVELNQIISQILEEDTNKSKTINYEMNIVTKEKERKQKDFALIDSVNKDFEELEKKNEHYLFLESQKDVYQIMRQTVELQKKALINVKPIYDQYIEASTRSQNAAVELRKKSDLLKTAKQDYTDSKRKFDEAEGKKTEADRIHDLVLKMINEEPMYQKKDQLLGDKYKNDEELSNTKGKKEKNKTDYSAAEEDLRNQKRIVADYQDSPVKKVQTEGMQRAVSDLLKNSCSLKKNELEKYNKALRRRSEAQEYFLKKQSESDKMEQKFSHIQRLFNANRAGLLAKDLIEGEKCPVCGSTHHPEPAVLSEAVCSEAELEKLRTDSNNLKSESAAASEAAGFANETLNNSEKELIQKTNELFGECAEHGMEEYTDCQTAEEAADCLKAINKFCTEKLKLINEDLERLKKECDSLTNANGQIDKLNKKLDNLQSDRKSIEDEFAELDKTHSAIQASLSALPELKYANEKAAVAARKALEHDENAIRKAIDNARAKADEDKKTLIEAETEHKTAEDTSRKERKNADNLKVQLNEILAKNGFADEQEFNSILTDHSIIEKNEAEIKEYENDKKYTKERIDELTNKLEGKEKKETSELLDEIEKLENKYKALNTQTRKCLSRIDQNKQHRDFINDKFEQSRLETHNYAVTKRLSDFVSGQLNGKVKITLEQYVQANGFDSIVAAANSRMRMMSNGQYELLRHENLGENGSKNSLNLDVLDNLTGKIRSVSSLSGGESFKASLALALGLSDRISSNAGGISVDSVFIDEGFGTLDENSLTEAMQMLTTLSTNGKMIGIISHRKELEERINQKLIVKKAKNKNGSSTEMVLD